MNNVKILNSPEESFYFSTPSNKEDGNDVANRFNQYVKKFFLKELSNQSDLNTHEEFLTSKNTNDISLILVLHNFGDGEFACHDIKSTYLSKNQSGEIKDINKIKDINNENDEIVIATVYHQLRDGKIVEYSLNKNYENKLPNIYHTINKIKLAYKLESDLPIQRDKKSFKI